MNDAEIAHTMEELAVRLGPKATELAPGVTLITKDGSQIGNGIIVKEVPAITSMADWLKQTNQKLWLVETDFGNRTRLCDDEITAWYNLGVQDNYDRWWEARLETIERVANGE